MNAETMSRLFRVNDPGRWGNVTTQIPKWYDTPVDFQDHISGGKRICMTPVGGDGTCYFGALDFDAKDGTPPMPHDRIHAIIDEHNLPINLFRSKSDGGAHGFLFSDESMAASDMQAMVKMYSWIFWHLLGEGNDIEVFPKQTDLSDGDGSCINLPWYNGTCMQHVEEPIRKASSITTPPCLSSLPMEGDRNNFFYHMCIFLTYQGVKNPKALLEYINKHPEIIPIDKKEISTITRSAQRHMARRREQKLGFGMGCNTCPVGKKSYCRFAGQQAVAEVKHRIIVEVLVSLSGDSLIRIHCDGGHIDASIDNAWSYIWVRRRMIANVGSADFPPMKQADWVKFMDVAVSNASRLRGTNSEDMAYNIMNTLRRWQKSFGDKAADIYEDVPVFLGPDKIAVTPLALQQRTSTKNTVALSAIVGTLKHFGDEDVLYNEVMVYTMSRHLLGVKANNDVAAKMMGANDVNDISEIRVESGPKARFFNKDGEWVEFTTAALAANPTLVEMLEANTLGDKFLPPLRFDHDEKH